MNRLAIVPKTSGRRKKGVVDAPSTIKDLRADFDSIASTWSGDTRFVAQATMFMAEMLVEVAEKLDAIEAARSRPRKKRQPSAYSRFASQGLKQGKTMTAVAAEWRALHPKS